ncbi:hypothetical protein WA026_006882 [Henosepilachna vigintioctopunctata]|uniref:Uncharacterized protein n=1 Tax=Henosepilachna vigintioctopunctata TaxID=420089 RepID=A0AAW1V7X8_9CUCU
MKQFTADESNCQFRSTLVIQLRNGRRKSKPIEGNNKVTDIQPPPPSRLFLVGDRDHNPPTGKERRNNEYCQHQKSIIYIRQVAGVM